MNNDNDNQDETMAEPPIDYSDPETLNVLSTHKKVLRNTDFRYSAWPIFVYGTYYYGEHSTTIDSTKYVDNEHPELGRLWHPLEIPLLYDPDEDEMNPHFVYKFKTSMPTDPRISATYESPFKNDKDFEITETNGFVIRHSKYLGPTALDIVLAAGQAKGLETLDDDYNERTLKTYMAMKVMDYARTHCYGRYFILERPNITIGVCEAIVQGIIIPSLSFDKNIVIESIVYQTCCLVQDKKHFLKHPIGNLLRDGVIEYLRLAFAGLVNGKDKRSYQNKPHVEEAVGDIVSRFVLEYLYLKHGVDFRIANGDHPEAQMTRMSRGGIGNWGIILPFTKGVELPLSGTRQLDAKITGYLSKYFTETFNCLPEGAVVRIMAYTGNPGAIRKVQAASVEAIPEVDEDGDDQGDPKRQRTA